MIKLQKSCCHRNERHSPIGRISHRLTSEGDTFLGQTIIEVVKVGAPQDIWYKLGEPPCHISQLPLNSIVEKRTPDNIVTGAINLNLSSVVAGELIVAPYHTMYSLLHEVSHVTIM